MPFIKDELIPDDPLNLEHRLFKFNFEDQKNLKEEFERPTGRKCEGAMIYDNFHLDAHLDPYGGRGARYLEKLMNE